jgi:hypothetical protein
MHAPLSSVVFIVAMSAGATAIVCDLFLQYGTHKAEGRYRTVQATGPKSVLVPVGLSASAVSSRTYSSAVSTLSKPLTKWHPAALKVSQPAL